MFVLTLILKQNNSIMPFPLQDYKLAFSLFPLRFLRMVCGQIKKISLIVIEWDHY
jgi:hypothetical protein